MADLPHNGHWAKAPDRRFDSTVVFVHHFGGTHQSSWRHQKFVNELGFDAVSFDLTHNHHELFTTTWKGQIKDILNAIAGPKIISSFSSPSSAVLRLLAEDRPANVHAWIADCGPFLDTVACIAKYYRYQTHVPRPLIPIYARVGVTKIGGLGIETKLQEWMQLIPRDLPILSIRCANDQLVPPKSIGRLFDTNPGLRLKVLEIQGCNHLEGLKTHASVYAPAVASFLGAKV